jgi:Tol biopolymer transport system component
MMPRLSIVFLLFVSATAAHAATYPPQYRWQTITTEHFLVHFPEGHESSARKAAAIAESAHERLVPLMRWEPADRTHLVLTDHVDVSNGSATPFPHNRMEVYLSAPGGDPSSALAYYDDWLDLVITHEYAHILHLDQAHRGPGALRRVLGRHPASFPNLWSPLWLTEGFATFVESELSEAGRVKGTFVEMVVRTAAIEGQLPELGQTAGLTPFWPGGSARYFYGSKFLEWIVRREGPDALMRYFNEYSGNLIPFLVNRTARKTLGASFTELWNEWVREQESNYTHQLARIRSEGMTSSERLTRIGYETKHPIVSPDGSRIAYSHRGPHERPTIRIYDLASGRDIATHTVNSTSPLSWSPDGGTIAYSDLEFHQSVSLLSDVYLWTIGERRERRLTRGKRLKQPAFTPDGRSLIAVANEGGRNSLVELDIETGTIRTLIAPDDETQFSEPHVSGDTIVLAEWSAGRIDIVTYSREGQRRTNLTSQFPRSVNAAPRFTDDGSTILFTSDVTGIANVYAVAADGGTPQRLTNVYGGAFFPTSRDGKTIWYSDYHAGGFDLARTLASTELPTTPRPLAPPSALAGRIDSDTATTGSAVSPYSPLQSVRPRWWSPIIATSVQNDDVQTTLGITTLGADVLGFHQYTATVLAEIDTRDNETSADLEYSLVYSYNRRYPTMTLAAFRYDDDVVSFRTPTRTIPYTTSNHRLVAQLSLPWRQIERQWYGSIGAVRDRVEGAPPEGIPASLLDQLGVFRGTLQGMRAGIIFNSARSHGFSVSRENGFTARADYENLSRSLGSDRTIQQLRGDLRGYLAVPWRRSPLGRHVLAARLAGGETTGAFVLQRELRVGGTGMGEFLGLESRNFPVRGYGTGTLRGHRAALGSVEYRMPVWQIDRGPGTWPLFLDRVIGNLFADAGTAWRRDGTRGTIASVGAEAALDVYLGFAAPFRYRAGVAWLLRDPGKGTLQPYVTLETSF